jgi:hypothetical protein
MYPCDSSLPEAVIHSLVDELSEPIEHLSACHCLFSWAVVFIHQLNTLDPLALGVKLDLCSST